MGALRAVELERFGMLGRGAIFERFARGELEDEDEVAVVHGPAPEYRSSVDSLVNMRATLWRALESHVIDAHLHEQLISIARQLFYADRSYSALLQRARADCPAQVLAARRLDVLEQFLADPSNRVDQKARDAEQVLVEVRSCYLSETLPAPAPLEAAFPATNAWQLLRRQLLGRGQMLDRLTRQVIEEVQLLGAETYDDLLCSAAIRSLCCKAIEAHHGLSSPDPFSATPYEFESFEQAVQAELPLVLEEVLREMPAALRASGELDVVAARARAKLRGAPSALGERELARYFNERLGCAVPEDLEEYAQSVGFATAERLLRAIAKEMSFVSRSSPG
jgi:hypothetical protein